MDQLDPGVQPHPLTVAQVDVKQAEGLDPASALESAHVHGVEADVARHTEDSLLGTVVVPRHERGGAIAEDLTRTHRGRERRVEGLHDLRRAGHLLEFLGPALLRDRLLTSEGVRHVHERLSREGVPHFLQSIGPFVERHREDNDVAPPGDLPDFLRDLADRLNFITGPRKAFAQGRAHVPIPDHRDFRLRHPGDLARPSPEVVFHGLLRPKTLIPTNAFSRSWLRRWVGCNISMSVLRISSVIWTTTQTSWGPRSASSPSWSLTSAPSRVSSSSHSWCLSMLSRAVSTESCSVGALPCDHAVRNSLNIRRRSLGPGHVGRLAERIHSGGGTGGGEHGEREHGTEALRTSMGAVAAPRIRIRRDP